MIITKDIDIKISGRNLNFYKNLGYDVKVGDSINIPINHISKNSSIKILVKCDVCDIEKESFFFAYNKYIIKSPDNKYRCNICNKELKKISNLKKYGVENYTNRVKYKKTLIKKYGGHFNKLDEFKNKIKNTNISKYGCEYPMNNDGVKDKYRNKIFEKYGTTCLISNDEIRKLSKETMNSKYGFTYSMQCQSIKDKIVKKSMVTKHNKLLFNNKDILEIDYESNIYTAVCSICLGEYKISPHLYSMRKKYNNILCNICNPIGNHNSGREMELLNFIKSVYCGEILTNCRNIINPYELDIYLPQISLAFEFNGIYWHSELFKDKLYHKTKSDMCEDVGLHLIHVWEDDWVYKNKIVKSIIENKLAKSEKIFARKCEIMEISDNAIISEFLINNHIQGFVGSKMKIGLFYKDKLVSLMTFGANRKLMNNKVVDNEYELLRYCNRLNMTVVGGASKLFNYFIKNYNPITIISYADRNFSNGKLYTKLGFKFDSKTVPNYYYIIDNIRKHRYNFRKDILVKEGYDSSKTESEIMSNRKIYKSYNAGNLKYIWCRN